MRRRHHKTGEHGGALLAVLWLVAALSAIAFTLAHNVRSETERTATASDSVRAYYLATGAVEKAILYMYWGPQYRNPDGSAKYYAIGQPQMHFAFPSGEANVEVIPESSKINVNTAQPKEINALLINLGLSTSAAGELTAAILDWRSPPEGPSSFSQFYAGRGPSFQPRHASLEEIEELLLVKGMTPELFYGSYTRSPEGQLVATGGLRNCVSLYSASDSVDVNTAEPAVLETYGLRPDQVTLILQRRKVAPFKNLEEFQELVGPGPWAGKLRIGGGTMFTLRATAQVRFPDGRLSELRRTVSALIKFRESGHTPPVETLRWYEN